MVGGPGAGKDTAAGLLSMHHNFMPHAFADALRDFVYAIDPGWAMACDTIGYDLAKTRVEGFRGRLVEVGNAARQSIGPDVWIDALDERVGPHLAAECKVVVSDVRYLNEAEFIREYGGAVVGIDRPGHAPETPESNEVFLAADEYVCNDGSITALWAELDALVDYLNS